MPRTPSLTDIDGILVGHYTASERPTGCTVVTASAPFVAGIDVRGGAPGTREIDLLKPENRVDQVDAIFLSGGSAFGLDVSAGISRYLEEHGRGFDTRVAKVPIVCGAILFDLALGGSKIRPGAEAGYRAIRSARSGRIAEGNVGAGAGATVGKLLGTERAMKGGLGTWALKRSDGLKVGALAAVNSIGDVVDPALGLPYDKGSYVTNPDTADADRAAYEVFDAQSGKVLEGQFVVGWARKASDGLVGKARFDAEQGCDHILKYLESAPKQSTPSVQEIVRAIECKGLRYVDKSAVKLLARAEEAHAKVHNLPAFKFPTNDEMLAAIEKEADQSAVGGTAAA